MLRLVPGFLIATLLSCIALAGAGPAYAVSAPDLTVSSANNVSGATTLGHPWTWTLHVANAPGTNVATFNTGQTILSDDLDTAPTLTYGAPVVTNLTSVTGPVACTISFHKLACTAGGGPVQLWGGGSFDVTFTVTPSYTGSFLNPRLFGSCSVDPNNVVAESNETNNTCNSDSVLVTAPDLAINQSDDASGGVDQGGTWHTRLAVTNGGSAPAIFPSGAVVLQDDLASSTGLQYGTPTVGSLVDTSGTIQCAIDTSSTLTCTAAGPVTIGALDGAFNVTIPVTGLQSGSYTNPRTPGICRVNPANTFVESDLTNNDCAPDSVAVYRSIDLGVTDVGTPDPNVIAGSNNGTDNLTHTITLTNHSPTWTASALVLIDLSQALPFGVKLDAVATTAGSYDQGTGYWTVPSLPAGQSATLTLTFSVAGSAADGETITTSPLATNVGNYVIDRNSSNDGATLVTRVQGSGIPHTVGISPLSKDYGNQRLNTTSTAQTFSVTNNGTSNLTVSSASLTGPDAGQYTLSHNTCNGAVIPPGQTCSADVAFSPTSTGAITTAYLEIASDALGPRADVVLHGTGTSSAVSTSPSLKLFGNQTVGTASAAQTFHITNNGGADLHNVAVTVAGTDSGQYVTSNNTCPVTLTIGSSCSIDVAFQPTSVGAHNSATLDIASDDSAGTVHLALSGTGIAPVLSPSPASVDFGNQRVGSSSATQTFQITNTGNGPLVISGVSLGGGDAGQFTMSNNGCVTQLAVSATCSVGVAFTPNSAGTHNATLDFTSNDPAGTKHVSLTGVGIQSILSPSMSSHDFGPQRLGTTSAAQRVTITNSGTDNLTIGTITLSGADAGQYVAANDTCSGTQLLPGLKCTIDLSFKPTVLGAHPSATLNIPNDSSSPLMLIGLRGTGTQPGLAASVNAIDFGGQRVGTSSDARRVTVTATGAGALTISAVSLMGSDAADYTLAADYCSSRVITAGGTCVIDVVFTPSAAGDHPATLVIRSDALTSPDSVTLSGSGTVPAIAISAPQKDYGAVAVGSSSVPATFTVSNTGSSPLTIGAASVGGGDASQYARQGDSCSGQSLAPSATCTISVIFRPTSVGAHNGAMLQVTSDGGTARAALAGRASPPSNAFTIAHVKVMKSGATTFDIIVRAPGDVAAVTSIPKLASFGQARVHVLLAGKVHITVNPTRAGRKALRRGHGKLRVGLAVTFTPKYGTLRKLSFRGLILKH